MKIKSLFILLDITTNKWFDQLHRVLTGLPTLKRSQITAQLFLGGQYNLNGLSKLKEMGITAIVNMRMASVYRDAHYQGFNYLHLPTPDQTPPSLHNLMEGADFIEKQIKEGGKVYIHCRQGQGRGPSMAIAYLIKSGLTFEEALDYVKKVRIFIKPTKEQIARLQEFEKTIGF